MPDVFLKRQSESELYFQHSFLGGWIFAAIGCGIVCFGIWYADSSSARWIAIGMGALFAAIGLGGALWRYELTLDLTNRGYRGRRGFWPSPRTLQGSLNELDGVLLTRTWRRNQNSEVVLRTDDLVARIAGDLSPDSQQWLCRTLLTLARR